jgi:hypothetical protein
MVLGHLATMVFAAIEGAVIGGLSVLGAALYGLGIPKDSVIQYEQALKADGFLIVAHGAPSKRWHGPRRSSRRGNHSSSICTRT